MDIHVQGYIPDCEEDEDNSATLLLTPDDYAEYGRVDVRIRALGCDKTIRCSVEELYAALSAAMAMRRQAQRSKAEENRGWLFPVRTQPHYYSGQRWE